MSHNPHKGFFFFRISVWRECRFYFLLCQSTSIFKGHVTNQTNIIVLGSEMTICLRSRRHCHNEREYFSC